MNNNKRTISFMLAIALIVNLMLVGVNTGSINVKAEDGVTETTSEETTIEPSGEETTLPLDEETTTSSDVETTTPDGETTTSSDVETTTTEPETTTEIVEPWGKNSQGQFVNGKGEVIVGATMKGIDVSHHQGKVDWAKVAASDVDYAIIRCGYGDNDKKQDDKYWEYNVRECEKYNIPYGVYIYSYATTKKEAKSEAKHVLRLIEGLDFSFPIYYDMEDKVQLKISKKKRKNIAYTFLNIMKEEGYECGVYANLNWWEKHIPKAIAKDTSLYKWVAQYNDTACDYTGSYEMWQCTSKGTVDGIYGATDINFWYGPVRDDSYSSRTQGTQPEEGTDVVPEPETTAIEKPTKVKWKKATRGKKKVSLKWKKVKGAYGYKIQYSTSKKFDKNVKTKYTRNTSKVVKKLKSKKTYYFRIKAYKLDNKFNRIYSQKWSKVKSRKTK